MVVGFNHNFNYKGELYHIQTEDSGVKTPHIITLLYRGGTILASKKTSYADIVKVDNLDQVVEDLMKEQHREMLRRLKNGELDHLLGTGASPPSAPAATPPAAASKPAPESKPESKAEPAEESPPPPPAAASLDEIILSYMVGEDRKK